MAKTETDSKVSRRGFLEGMAVAGVAAGALAGVKVAAQSQRTTELRTDVVVCGTGIAGLTSAIRAQKAGAKVIVLEKAYEPGGTTAHSEGGVGETRDYQALRNAAPEGDPVVQKMIADNLPGWHPFMHTLGAPVGGTWSVGSGMAPVAWVNFMVNALESGAAKVMVDTPMIKLLTNAQNEVIGVLADSPKGLIRILAKSVVLATGGWMTNPQMMMANISRYFGMMRQRNAALYDRKPPFLGDGLFAALAIGAQPSTGAFDGFYGHLLPARPGKITNPMATWSCYFSQYCVAVNRFGKRFCDEGQGRLTGRPGYSGSEANCVQEVARQPDAMAAYIYDDLVYKMYACENCGLGGMDKYLAYKLSGAPVAMANSIPELAKQMEAWGIGMSAENIIRDVTDYNNAAANGKAWALPIPKYNTKQAMVQENPPYYAVLGQAGITSTHGGIRIDGRAQVLHRSGKPIPGLYAAGVDVGNYNNIHYNGNLTLGAGTGFVAGDNAAKQPAPQGGFVVATAG